MVRTLWREGVRPCLIGARPVVLALCREQRYLFVSPCQLAEDERGEPIGLPACWAEPRSGGGDLVGVHRQRGQTSVEQPLDRQPVWSLDGDLLEIESQERAAQSRDSGRVPGHSRGQQKGDL
jgi:hypothetical protein